MSIKFTAIERIETGVKKEELELVDRHWVDPLKVSAKKQRNKHKKMNGFVILLRVNSDKVNEDLAWVES